MALPQSSTGEPRPTHERLRAVAAELFARRGYGGTSMSEIAAGVGVRKASLYNYYASKEELLKDLVEESLEAWSRCCQPALEGGGPLAERLYGHARAAVQFTTEHREKAAMVRVAATQIGGELGREVRRLLTEHREQYLETLEGFFAQAVARGELPRQDPLTLALAYRIFLDGLLSNLIFRAASAERYGERLPELWALFWRGISGGAKPEVEEVEG